MQNAGVLQQQIWAMSFFSRGILKIFFLLSRAPVLQRSLKSCTQMFWSSSCASSLAALFSPQLYITLSWSLLLWKKSFRKTPGEQNTLSLNKAGGCTHQVYILSSCLYICLHFTSGPNPHILPCLHSVSWSRIAGILILPYTLKAIPQSLTGWQKLWQSLVYSAQISQQTEQA